MFLGRLSFEVLLMVGSTGPSVRTLASEGHAEP
jgi:hypothetical protein